MKMPPTASLTGSFSLTDVVNEVVCPLRNHDSSSCRKRCIGEKRYRSMQEHIRRAHPEHYIPKLPATEESFSLMINTPPSERPALPLPLPPPPHTLASGHLLHAAHLPDDGYRPNNDDGRRSSLLPAASAAAALAQLHYQRLDSDRDSEHDTSSELDTPTRRRKNFPARSILDHTTSNANLDPAFAASKFPRPPLAPANRQLLPSSLERSPPGRSSTLPPIARPLKGSGGANGSRPRKSSITQNSRRPKHDRLSGPRSTRPKDHVRRMSHDRKAFSAEPQTVWGRRWEDLLDAAISATEEESSRDLTPVAASPRMRNSHGVLPPPLNPHINSYTASPLQRVLTPPQTQADGSSQQPYPSVESSTTDSTQSGQNFHLNAHGLSSDSSPAFQQPVQIYCAACRRIAILKDSYACTECICALCQECVDVLVSEHARGRVARCPRCGTVGGRFKPFQLEFR